MRPLSICLINPKFNASFFGQEYALPLLPGDKRCVMITGALPLLAALVPDGHSVQIMDENVAPIDFGALHDFDVIGLTGMIVHKQRMAQILEELRGFKGVLCVGGPYATVDEKQFEGKCDVLFIGEADETWPQFLEALAAERPFQSRYKQETPTDMTTLPVPRYDLVANRRYLSVPIQFSRGCPFLCEFCDIIVIFGRRPRTKEASQILSELDALYALGVRFVFFVDDNFIGNKAVAKVLLREVITWQEQHGYAMRFMTEASINLSDDEELMELLCRANFGSVFVGIESPRAESLLETRKVQNARGASMMDRIDRIRDFGLIVQGGFIVGFDNDDELIFDEQFSFIQRSGIGLAIVSILSPIPSTPLYERLAKEGRLDEKDDVVWFEPKLMSRETLKNRYVELNTRLYRPEAFFERAFGGYRRSAKFRQRRAEMDAKSNRNGLRASLLSAVAALIMTWRLARALFKEGQLGLVGRAYITAWRTYNKPLGREALPLADFVGMCVRHWHHFNFARDQRSHWGRAGAAQEVLAGGYGIAKMPRVVATSTERIAS